LAAAMNGSKRLSLATAFLLALTVVFDAGGTLLLSGGMKHVGRIDTGAFLTMVRAFGRAIARAEIWLGIAALLLWFICSLVLFSRIDFSYVQPASAAGYALVALLGYAVLGEVVTAARSAGIVCICAGVILIGRTPPRTTE
jgi:drug/metabolite transporter (DMT)-like permease